MSMLAKAKKLGNSNKLKPTKKNVAEQRTQLLKNHLTALATQQGTSLQVAGSTVIEETVEELEHQSNVALEPQFIDPLVQSTGPQTLHNGIAAVAAHLNEETAEQVSGLLDSGRVAGLSKRFDPQQSADLEFGKEVIALDCFTTIVRLSVQRMKVLRSQNNLNIVGSEASMLEMMHLSLAS